MHFLAHESAWFQYLVLPLLIFLARVFDVSVGTVRVILLNRGMRLIAPLLGFFEVLIWLLAIGQIMKNLSNPACYLAYAAGFASGNFVGMLLEVKLAMGLAMVRVMVSTDSTRLRRFLAKAGYRVTLVRAEGSRGPVEILFTVVRRRHLRRVADLIQRLHPKAFYTIEDVRFASETGSIGLGGLAGNQGLRRMLPRRKGK
jgi:uncharacterized protein YebE (UPF0316 family)